METNVTLEFLPEERRKTVTLHILDDLLLDDGEILNVILTTTDPQVMIGRDNVTVTILDTDCKLASIFMHSAPIEKNNHTLRMYEWINILHVFEWLFCNTDC